MDNDPNRRRVLVTDGEQRSTLATVRSLGSAGHIVHVCASRRRSLAGASHFAQSEHRVTSALTNPPQFADDVQTLVALHGIDTVIPMTEPALLALLPIRERFGDVLIPFADADAFAAISDKQAVLDAAARVGIAVPAQIVVADAETAALMDTSAIRYPVVVKPARSVSTGGGSRLKFSAQHASTEAVLRSIINNIDARAFPLLVQQRIVGAGVGIFALVWNGDIIAQFAHLRIREQPPAGGISVYRQSIAADPRLLQASLALLAEFDWRGVAMIEYKIDERTGVPYLMEINGRFWGSLQLAVDAGVDFPRLLIEVACGLAPAPVTEFRTDVRSRWFWGDVDHLIARLRRPDDQLALPSGSPSRWAAVRQFFTRHPDDVNEILRGGDMKPFLRESLQWFQHLGR